MAVKKVFPGSAPDINRIWKNWWFLVEKEDEMERQIQEWTNDTIRLPKKEVWTQQEINTKNSTGKNIR